MSQNYDKAKLLQRLLLEENARRGAVGLKLLTMQEFIQLNQATEEEVKNSRSKTYKSSYRPPSYRQNRPLSYNDRVLLRDAGRGAVTGITQAGTFTQEFIKSIDYQTIALKATPLIQKAQQNGKGVIKSKEFQAFTAKTSELSDTVMAGVTAGIQKLNTFMQDEDNQKMLQQGGSAVAKAYNEAGPEMRKQMEALIQEGNIEGLKELVPDISFSPEEAELFFKNFWAVLKIMKKVGGLIWTYGGFFFGGFFGAIGEAVKFVLNGEVPEADLLDVKLKF